MPIIYDIGSMQGHSHIQERLRKISAKLKLGNENQNTNDNNDNAITDEMLATADARQEFNLLLSDLFHDIINNYSQKEVKIVGDIINKITKWNLKKIKEEQIQIFLRKEEIAKAERRLKEIVNQEYADRWQQNEQEYERLRNKAEEDLAKLKEQFQQQTADRLAALEKERQRIDDDIAKLIEMKQSVVNKHSKGLAKELESNQLFKQVPPEQREKVSAKVIELTHDKKRKIEKVKGRKMKLKEQINTLEQLKKERQVQLRGEKPEQQQQNGEFLNISRVVLARDKCIQKLEKDILKLKQEHDQITEEKIERDIQKIEQEYKQELHNLPGLENATNEQLDGFIQDVENAASFKAAHEHLDVLDDRIEENMLMAKNVQIMVNNSDSEFDFSLDDIPPSTEPDNGPNLRAQ